MLILAVFWAWSPRLIYQEIIDRGDDADGLVDLVALDDAIGLVTRQELEHTLAGGFHAAQFGAGILGELFGGLARVFSRFGNHFRFHVFQLAVLDAPEEVLGAVTGETEVE